MHKPSSTHMRPSKSLLPISEWATSLILSELQGHTEANKTILTSARDKWTSATFVSKQLKLDTNQSCCCWVVLLFSSRDKALNLQVWQSLLTSHCCHRGKQLTEYTFAVLAAAAWLWVGEAGRQVRLARMGAVEPRTRSRMPLKSNCTPVANSNHSKKPG